MSVNIRLITKEQRTNLIGKQVQTLRHPINSDLQSQDLAFHVDSDTFREITVGDGRSHVSDRANLQRQVSSRR